MKKMRKKYKTSKKNEWVRKNVLKHYSDFEWVFSFQGLQSWNPASYTFPSFIFCLWGDPHSPRGPCSTPQTLATVKAEAQTRSRWYTGKSQISGLWMGHRQPGRGVSVPLNLMLVFRSATSVSHTCQHDSWITLLNMVDAELDFFL